MKTIEDVRDETAAALDVPDGFYVRVDGDGAYILVGNRDLAFAITRKEIEDGLAVDRAKAAFPHLLKAVELAQRG